MSKVTTLARFMLAFLIIAGGLSIIIGSLMGGGFSSRASEYVKGNNNDPRSILIRAVLIDAENGVPLPSGLPVSGRPIAAADFESLQKAARTEQASDGPAIRAPAVLVQHAETAAISIDLADRSFEAMFAPRVIDTEHGPVLRVAIDVAQSVADSSGAERQRVFQTAYTSAPGGSVVFDLAGLGRPGDQAVLALHTELVDPTPPPSD